MTIAILLLADQSDQDVSLVIQQLASAGMTRIVVVSHEPGEDPSNSITWLDYPSGSPGSAILMGLRVVYEKYAECQGVVLVNLPKHYYPAEILALAAEAANQPEKLLVAERRSNGKTALHYKILGAVSQVIVRLFLGNSLHDLRSGLKAFPISAIPTLLSIPADRSEFNLEMLLACKKAGITIKGYALPTLVADANEDSQTLINSLIIYFIFTRYISTSLLTAAVDYLVFILSYPLIQNVLVCIYLARLAAILINFVLLRKVVFYSSDTIPSTFLKYITVVLFSGFITALLINFFNSQLHIRVVLGKMMAELLLYFVNFYFLNRLVFIHRKSLVERP